MPPDPGGNVVVEPRQKYRASVLDVVAGDIERLQSRVGSADRARLQQHFDAVRDLEHTLASLGGPTALPASCGTPERPATTSDYKAKNQAMARVLAMALACGQTRVFTYQLAGTRDYHSWDAAGVAGNYHSLTHETGAAAFEAIGKVNTYQQDLGAELFHEERTYREAMKRDAMRAVAGEGSGRPLHASDLLGFSGPRITAAARGHCNNETPYHSPRKAERRTACDSHMRIACSR